MNHFGPPIKPERCGPYYEEQSAKRARGQSSYGDGLDDGEAGKPSDAHMYPAGPERDDYVRGYEDGKWNKANLSGEGRGRGHKWIDGKAVDDNGPYVKGYEDGVAGRSKSSSDSEYLKGYDKGRADAAESKSTWGPASVGFGR